MARSIHFRHCVLDQRSFWISPVVSIKLKDIIHLLVVITFLRRLRSFRIALACVPKNSVWVGCGLVLLAKFYDIRMPPCEGRLGLETSRFCKSKANSQP